MRAYLNNLEEIQFLRDYDHHLLLNHPKLWVIRLPYLLLYFVLANVFTFLFFLFLPLQLHHVQDFYILLAVIFMAVLAALYFWIRQFKRYSPEKAFEDTSAWMGWVDYLVYLGCILLILSPSITSALTMRAEFDKLIAQQELHADRRQFYSLEWDERLPVELAQKYTGLPIEELRIASNYEIHSQVGVAIDRLELIKEGKFDELKGFLVFFLPILHLGSLIYFGKHVTNKITRRAFMFTVLFLVAYFLYLILLDVFLYSTFILGRFIGELNEQIFIWPGPVAAVTIYFAVMAASVFWRRKRSLITAVSVVLLPLGVAILLIYSYFELHDKYNWWRSLNMEQEYWIGMALFSPLIYLWMVPLLKAMYMRLLALPVR